MNDIRSAANGDAAAFARLVDQTKHTVTSIALGILRDLRASEDVAQEVFFQAWRDLPSLRNADSFLPWIRQLTRHEALSQARSRRRFEKRHAPWEADVDAAGNDPTDRAISEEERLVLEEALAAMPDDARDVLTLFYREGRSIKHVAELLGLGESAVKKRLERARTALKADVEARFADIASKTAVGAGFVGAVTGSLAFAAPGAAAAALAAPKGSVGLALMPLLAPPIVSITAGLAVVIVLMRGLIKTAIDERERRELRKLRHLACGLIVGFHAALAASLAAIPWIGNLASGGGFLAAWLLFGLGGGWLLSHRLPIILARRRAVERAADPAAFAEAERRRRRRASLVLAVSGALFVLVVWAILIRP